MWWESNYFDEQCSCELHVFIMCYVTFSCWFKEVASTQFTKAMQTVLKDSSVVRKFVFDWISWMQIIIDKK